MCDNSMSLLTLKHNVLVRNSSSSGSIEYLAPLTRQYNSTGEYKPEEDEEVLSSSFAYNP